MCSATATYARAYGQYANATIPGQLTQATGRFAALGDQQTSVIPVAHLTTDATTATMGILGSSNAPVIQPNQSAAFSILLVARVAGGTDTAAWQITGVLRRGASGACTYVGTPTITLLGADAGAAAWTVALASYSDGGLALRITGQAATTIRWVTRITLAEVIG